METAALNFLRNDDRALVVNAGTFGQRWCDLCTIHGIAFESLPLEPGDDLDLDRLATALSKGVTVLFVTAHETSTGALFDIEAIGRLTRRLGIFLIVDAISTVCVDPFLMDEWNVDVAVLSSQKGLALPPGLAFIAMGDRALSRLETADPKTLYFSIPEYLANQKRGQLPFTPAIGLMLQLHQRLLDIRAMTLVQLHGQHRQKAHEFREALKSLPFGMLPDRPSNALTAVTCGDLDAYAIVQWLRSEHGIEVAPSGGALKSQIFRVSHMGEHDSGDLPALVHALKGIPRSLPATREPAVAGGCA
jgi:aspartate aminotransferase-like enzyme